ncbi:uncharacterized protein MELLADRAFT_117592 [Melampsora larici-populina 98AG31]|uniref:Uncharacterized protein n=1 Tax=Melampsora larici-populina (strain 98AG31 / pathotype 3-4-7) TaxID=747676 RepID=F4RZ52_MELLP|nr:uncharacterized protein MELLADRAFT_117592 [Melampsora larici-populina 98AG31]EGG02350.1 hypothetical protein MELLADRAFT_117592 [Melampsora larici-populina 98AG31]
MARSISSRHSRSLLRLAFGLAIITFAFIFRFDQWLPTNLISEPSDLSKQLHSSSSSDLNGAHLASKIKGVLTSPYHFGSQFALPVSWTGLLKEIRLASSLGSSKWTYTRSSIEIQEPPSIKLLKSNSLPSIEALPKNHLLEKVYTKSINDINDAVRRILTSDPIISSPEFKNRTSGIPGTAITANADRQSLQRWLDCTSSQGEWRWEPLANANRRPFTVHKQGPLEAKCDRSYYQASGRDRDRLITDGWSVRPSLKFRWYPSNQCNALRPRQLKQDVKLSRRDLCRLLRHKNILVVGDIAQYAMHDLLLDWTSTTPVTCYGDLYCKEHGICGGDLDDKWKGSADQLESGTLDDYVYHQLPSQPSNQPFEADEKLSKIGAAGHGLASLLNASAPALVPRASHDTSTAHKESKTSPARGTILRFRRSDSLWASSSPSHRRFAPVWQHDNTGIRDINNYWITDSRKSDLVVLSRPPIPFPLPTHQHKAFTKPTDILATHLQYLRHPSNNKTMPSVEYFENGGITAAAELVEMACRMVLEVWLPELLYSLLSLRSNASPVDQLMVWRGEWRIQTDCGASQSSSERTSTSQPEPKTKFDWNRWWQKRAAGDGPPPHTSLPTLLTIMFPDFEEELQDSSYKNHPTASRLQKLDTLNRLRDPSTVFHNLQVIFQNHLLRQLLPIFGIPFLDLESLTSIWRSGMVGGSSVSNPKLSSSPQFKLFGLFHQSSSKSFSPKINLNPIDCLHYCFPSPGMAIEEAFIGGLLKVFHVGWDSKLGQEKNWVGDAFVPVREREEIRREDGQGI